MRATPDVIAARSMRSVNGCGGHGVRDVFVICERVLNGNNVVKQGRAVTVDNGVAIHDIFGVAGSAGGCAMLKTVRIEVTLMRGGIAEVGVDLLPSSSESMVTFVRRWGSIMNGRCSTGGLKFRFITEAALLKGDLFFVVFHGAFKGVDTERTLRNGFGSRFIVM